MKQDQCLGAARRAQYCIHNCSIYPNNIIRKALESLRFYQRSSVVYHFSNSTPTQVSFHPSSSRSPFFLQTLLHVTSCRAVWGSHQRRQLSFSPSSFHAELPKSLVALPSSTRILLITDFAVHQFSSTFNMSQT